MKGNGQIRRNRPRRRGPDEHRDGMSAERRHPCGKLGCRRLGQRKFDVDRGRGVRLVLDFSLRQRSSAMDAPVNRLLPLVDESARHERAECPDDGGLIFRFHRQVRVRPVARAEQPLELFALDFDETHRVGAAGSAEIGGRHLALLRAELTIDLQLDRQPVAIPARHIWRVEAGHVARADDEVLEDLVECVSDVDVSVRVRRPVVKHVEPCPLPALARAAFEPDVVPAGERLWLRHGEIRLHREVGARQIERGFPVGHTKRSIVPQAFGPAAKWRPVCQMRAPDNRALGAARAFRPRRLPKRGLYN